MDPRLIAPLLLGAVVLWGVYRRIRRSFGRQPVNAARLYLRAGVLGLIGVLLLAAVWRHAALLGALLGGGACGALLAILGLRHTRFEVTQQGRFYTPHSYIGALLLALFLGRLLLRFAQLSGTHAAVPAAVPRDPLAGYEQNPVTLVLIGLLIGYYVLYNLGVLSRSRSAG